MPETKISKVDRHHTKQKSWSIFMRKKLKSSSLSFSGSKTIVVCSSQLGRVKSNKGFTSVSTPDEVSKKSLRAKEASTGSIDFSLIDFKPSISQSADKLQLNSDQLLTFSPITPFGDLTDSVFSNYSIDNNNNNVKSSSASNLANSESSSQNYNNNKNTTYKSVMIIDLTNRSTMPPNQPEQQSMQDTSKGF
jgi:hypothetical protein